MLNRGRELQSAVYDEHVADLGRNPRLVLLGGVMLGIGAALAVGWVLLLVRGTAEDGLGWLPGVLILALVPGSVLLVGVLALVSHRRASRLLAAYQARAADRDGWRQVMAQLADRWQGTLSVGAVGAACEFLIEHWPDPAPCAVLTPLKGERSDRLVVVATVQGFPALAQVVDTTSEGGFAPPVVTVLLARPISPDAKVAAAATPAGSRLVEQDIVVRWNRAGVCAMYDDPRDSLTVEALDGLARSLIEVSDQAPAAVPVSGPATVEWAVPAGRDEVVEYFLSALRDGDLYAAMACADTRLGGGHAMELTPEVLGAAVAGVRPVSWRRSSVTSGGAATYRFEATMMKRSSTVIEVHVVEQASRWRVCGYTVDNKLICGIAHEWSD